MARVDDRARDRDVGGSVLAPCEQVVLLAELQRANLALSFAVVEHEAPIREAALEVLSLIGRVRRRLVQPCCRSTWSRRLRTISRRLYEGSGVGLARASLMDEDWAVSPRMV